MQQPMHGELVEEVALDSVIEQYVSQCSAEPIHLLGRIQPHGCVLVVNLQTGLIVQASSGIHRYLPQVRDALRLVDTPLRDWLVQDAQALSAVLAGLSSDFGRPLDLHFAAPAGAVIAPLECLGYRCAHYAVLEWVAQGGTAAAPGLEVKQMLALSMAVSRLRKAGTLEAFYQECVQELQAISGYDHVMLYRFLPDWSGEVVAEQAAPGLKAKFLGMRFPPGDIPPQARALYEANTLRVLADVQALPDTLVPPLLPSGQAVDLGHSLLRGMSQSHLVYLRNMGVRATLTISLLRDGKLWGLLACHHHQPRVPHGEVREVLRSSCELISSLVTMQIDHLERVEKSARNAAFVDVLSALGNALMRGDGFVESVTALAQDLCKAFGAQDFGVRLGDMEFVSSKGESATRTALKLDCVDALCTAVRPSRVPGVHLLRRERDGRLSELPDATSALVVHLATEPPGLCFFTRVDTVQSVRWAGAPDRVTAITTGGHVRLEARRSFDLKEEEVWSSAPPWDEADMDALVRLGALLADAFRNQVNRDLQKQLHWRAHHDHLTGLLNRSVVEVELPRRLAQPGASVALYLIDLDHFKRINDTLGHAAGDEVLREIGTRFAAISRGDNVVARLGGDEFLLFCNLDESAVAGRDTMAQRLHDVMVPVFGADGKTFGLSVSVGVAYSPQHGLDASTLMRHADMALYEAKGRGRACTAYFDLALESSAEDAVELEAQLRQAIGQDQLRLHYQPKVNLQTQKVVGFEALVRWQHPSRGLLGPNHFIPMAERCQLINPVGRWVISEAMAQLARWAAQGQVARTVAVNVSFVQIVTGSLLRDIAECAAQHQVDLSLLELELTETVLMGNTQQTIDVLRELDKLGVKVSLDDFGTGYSSLAYVQQLPLDALKIDRSFVMRLDQDPQSQVVTSGIVGLSQGLKLATIAEGVETHAQWRWLVQQGCEFAQGYLFSRPVPVAELDRAIATIEAMAQSAA
jgi:diguanylate cyclase (GGDEF)-like protein